MSVETAAHDLASALGRARERGLPAVTAPRPATLEEAERTAALLYGQLAADGARQVGWKLGATDVAVQRRLGTDRPFVAPVYDVMTAPLPSPVSMSRLVAPVLEVEIGIDRGTTAPTIRPCVEIADSRYPDWPGSLPEAIADFGLQGVLLAGDPVPAVAAVTATVWRDSEVQCDGSRTYAEATALAAAADADGGSRAQLVATGTITPPVPLAVGHWRIELGELGSFEFEVTP